MMSVALVAVAVAAYYALPWRQALAGHRRARQLEETRARRTRAEAEFIAQERRVRVACEARAQLAITAWRQRRVRPRQGRLLHGGRA